MPADGNIVERIHELESRLAHQEETIDKLNDVVRDQWAGIDRLQKILQQLESRITEVEEKEASAPIQQPPHY